MQNMQNIFRKNLNFSSRKIVYNKRSSFSFLTNKNNFYKNFLILKKDGDRLQLIKYTKFNFSNKDTSNEKKEEEKKNEENEKQEEQNEEENQAEYKTSRKIRFVLGKIIKYCFILGGILTFYNAYLYKKKEAPETHTGYFKPLNSLVKSLHKFWFLTYGSLTLPYYEKILPDALELQGQPSKKTLVINLNKTLINYEYKFGNGFEILRRPGLMKFLSEMGQQYEVVIFGTEDSNFVEEVCKNLDQFDMNIKYKLGREATRLVNGEYVKDLYFLNRDLKNVVCIDYNPESVTFNPRNTVIIPEFLGDGRDRELIQAIVFLKELARPEVKDVRKELDKYGNYRPYIKFYKSNPKYKKLLPKEEYENVLDDSDLQAVKNKK